MNMPPKNVKIYTTAQCGYCAMLKNYLTEHKIAFSSVDVGSDKQAFLEMREKTGFMSVPVIDIDGKVIIGFDKDAIAKELGL